MEWEQLKPFGSDHVHLSLEKDSRVGLMWKKGGRKNESFQSDPSLDIFMDSNKSQVCTCFCSVIARSLAAGRDQIRRKVRESSNH